MRQPRLTQLEQDEGCAAVHEALRLGINVFDVSPCVHSCPLENSLVNTRSQVLRRHARRDGAWKGACWRAARLGALISPSVESVSRVSSMSCAQKSDATALACSTSVLSA